jgi:hypothetical protein
MTGARKPRGSGVKAAASAYADHKAWFAQVQAEVAAGSPFAVVSAEVPVEIFEAMQIPYVSVQWWSSIVSAKQKAPQYLGWLKERGLPDDQEQYFALGLASSFDTDPESAPWGGLPRPTLIVGDPRDDNHGKIYELWAREYGCPYYPYERTIFNDAPDAWWDLGRHRWDELIDPACLDIHVEETRGLIRFLEQTTGRPICETAFKRVLALVNEQEEYFTAVRDLQARTVPAPLSVNDTFTSVMMPQWRRGTTWGRDMAKAFHDEVQTRVQEGVSACPEEKIRLAWFGTGLWFNTGFYDAFQEDFGAVFVWSMYLAVAADAYARYGDEDPLRTLAARYAAFIQYMTMEPWPSSWVVKECQLNQIDGVVSLGGGGPFLATALADAGVPTLDLRAHNVDSRQWDEDRARTLMADFLRDQAGPRAERRRASGA